MPNRTQEGKWAIFRVSDGQRFERWPIDAKGMVASGEYSHEPKEPEDAADTSQVKVDEKTVINPALVSTATVDPVKGLPVEYAPGVALNVTPSHQASPARIRGSR